MLAAAAAVAGLLVVATPLRGVAGNFLEVFEPRTVAFVPITLEDMRGLSRMPDLSEYGTSREIVHSNSVTVADARLASGLARFDVRVPTVGIATNAAKTNYTVASPSSQQFAFSAAKARAVAVAQHRSLAPMPPGLDGSTLEIDLGSSVVTTYVSSLKPTHPFASRPVSGSRHAGLFESSDTGAAPVVVAQMRAPRIFSTGVSTATLEAYLLQQPGFPPRLAAAFRAIGDPATTLPIPIPVDKAYAQPLAVDGVRGIGIGDDTGLGAAVIWQNRGVLYAVFAPLAARDVLAIADSLR
jgi:hypothetical protein